MYKVIPHSNQFQEASPHELVSKSRDEHYHELGNDSTEVAMLERKNFYYLSVSVLKSCVIRASEYGKLGLPRNRNRETYVLGSKLKMVYVGVSVRCPWRTSRDCIDDILRLSNSTTGHSKTRRD